LSDAKADKLYASGLHQPFDTAAEAFSGVLPASKAEVRKEIKKTVAQQESQISQLTEVINQLVAQVNALSPVSSTSL